MPDDSAIGQLLRSGQRSFSFEFFPPKSDAGFQQILLSDDLDELLPAPPQLRLGHLRRGRLHPPEDRRPDRAHLQNEIGIRSMAHLTCVGHTADEIGRSSTTSGAAGIRNVLALRGDPPAGR